MAADAILQTEARLKDFISQNLDRINKNVRLFETQSQKSFTGASKSANTFGNTIQNLGRLMAVGIAARGFQVMTKSFISFESRMAEVNTIAKLGAKDIKALGTELTKMSLKLPKNANELGAGFYQVLSAGVTDTAEALKVLEASTKVAVGGIADTGSTVKLVTAILNSYSMDVSEVTNVTDILFKTVEKGVTTIPELASTLGRVLPIAKTAGISLEEMSAAMATLTTLGLPTARATTALSGAILALKAPTEAAKLEMEALGISWQDNLIDTVKQFQGMDLPEIRELIPEKEAAVAVLNLATGIEMFGNNTEAAFNSAGAASKAFATQMETTGAKLTLAQNKFESIQREIGGKLAPRLIEVIDLLKDMPGALQLVTVAIPPLVIALAALGGPLTLAGIAFTGIMVAVAKVNSRINAAAKLTPKYAETVTDMAEAVALAAKLQEKLNIKTKEYQAVGEKYVGSAANITAAREASEKQIQKEALELRKAKDILDLFIATQNKVAEGSAGGKGGDGPKPTAEGDDAETKERKAQELFDAIVRLREAELLFEQDVNQRLLDQLKLKHELEIEALGNNFKAIEELKKAHEIEMENLEVDVEKKKDEQGKEDTKRTNREILDNKRKTISMVGATGQMIGAIGMLAEATGASASTLKTIRIFEVIVNTAAGVMRAFAELPFPLSAVTAGAIGITGAAQLAAIKSAKFAEGTSFAPGGQALVGERGPELVNLPRGSQVFNNETTHNIVNQSERPINVTIINDDSETLQEKITAGISNALRDNQLEDFRMDFANAN